MARWSPYAAAIALLLVVTGLDHLRAAQGSQSTFDVLIIGGRIVDGSGAPWFAADVGISGDRGLLREGLAADITIFDSSTIVDRATFTDPHHYSEGVRWVLVNGEVVLDAGAHTGARPGRVLRRTEARSSSVPPQRSATAEPLPTQRPPTRADILRGEYGPYRANNDLLMTEDVVRFFNAALGQDLTPIFDQYLRRTAIPTLELAFNESEGTVAYRWKADERAFAMPIRVGVPGTWQTITPTTDWKRMPNTLAPDAFEVATDLYYVNVVRF